MQTAPTVVVKKSGFFSALAFGLFGFLTTCVVCASAVATYAIHVADRQAVWVTSFAGEFLTQLPDWMDSLPPILSDNLDDRRALDYSANVSADVRLVGEDRKGRKAVIEVTNRGKETISLLVLNVLLEDEEGNPVANLKAYAATPIAVNEDGWQGPLPPGQTRKFTQRAPYGASVASASVEPIELRVWNQPAAQPAGAPADDVEEVAVMD